MASWLGLEGKPMQVSIYSSANSVRLELNGKVIDEKNMTPESKLTAKFDVPYSPGELKAIALKDGKEIAVKMLKTSGKATTIRLYGRIICQKAGSWLIERKIKS